MNDPIRVVLADDHPLVRAGIRTSLAAEPGIEVVGEAADGDEALEQCRLLQPDMLLLDLSMPGLPPLALIQALRAMRVSICILILTAHNSDAFVRGMAEAGVQGYILKDEAPDALAEAIHAVAAGGEWYSHAVMDKLTEFMGQTSALPNGALTRREHALLHLIAIGWDNARIAEELFLAEQTVRNYSSRLYSKLGLASRAETIIWARENGYAEDAYPR